MKSKLSNPIGKWETKRVFVPSPGVTSEQVDEEMERQKMDEVAEMIGLGVFLHGVKGGFKVRVAAAEAFGDYFPGSNKVPDEGGWILVKTPPPCEYTIPPLSIWFAEPWPMQNERHCSHRVKIITPKGELGLFPREYSLIDRPEKYYEFIGNGMDIKFFGDSDNNLSPKMRDALFYIRSRGVSKADALTLLIGTIKAHGVLWIESRPEVCAEFGMKWPQYSKLATK